MARLQCIEYTQLGKRITRNEVSLPCRAAAAQCHRRVLTIFCADGDVSEEGWWAGTVKYSYFSCFFFFSYFLTVPFANFIKFRARMLSAVVSCWYPWIYVMGKMLLRTSDVEINKAYTLFFVIPYSCQDSPPTFFSLPHNSQCVALKHFYFLPGLQKWITCVNSASPVAVMLIQVSEQSGQCTSPVVVLRGRNLMVFSHLFCVESLLEIVTKTVEDSRNYWENPSAS